MELLRFVTLIKFFYSKNAKDNSRVVINEKDVTKNILCGFNRDVIIEHFLLTKRF